MKLSQNIVKSASSAVIHCFLFQENHHIRDCPKKQGNLENRKTRGFEAWKNVEPKDLNSTITDAQGLTWKFCTKYVCQYTRRIGMYTLSHGDAEHINLKNASASMIGTESPESNVVSTSSLEHIGI
jgi:hypothetical protein